MATRNTDGFGVGDISESRDLPQRVGKRPVASAGMAMQAQPQPAPDFGDKIRTLKLSNVRTISEGVALPTTASKLRANIYRMLDEVLETGQPLEVERNGRTLVIAPKEEQSIWDRLPRREGAIVGDPDELIHIDWSSEWNPDPN